MARTQMITPPLRFVIGNATLQSTYYSVATVAGSGLTAFLSFDNALDKVTIKGWTWVVVATVPDLYRPSGERHVMLPTGNNQSPLAEIKVMPDGTVSIQIRGSVEIAPPRACLPYSLN